MRLLNRHSALVVIAVTAIAVTGAPSPNSVAAAALGPTVSSMSPQSGEVVGVAAPIVLTFTKPVANRRAAERAFTITTPNVPSGQFEWLNSQTLQWKSDGFLPSHSVIALSLGGFKADVTTGASVVGVADISEHTFTVSIDGAVARTMPASMGKPSRPTPIGSFSVLSRERSVVMDSRTIGIPLSDPEGYKITAYYAERITGGGVYVHSAPWSVDSQGYANVSHGCINLSPDNAQWYYNTVHIGDPVTVQA